MIKSNYRSYLLKTVLLAATYFAAAMLGRLMTLETSDFPLIWPAAGLALAALLVFGYQLWPGILLGGLLAFLSMGLSLGSAIIFTAVSLLETLLATYLLQRVAIDWTLPRVKDIVYLILLGADLGSILSATLAVGGLCLTAQISWSEYLSIWWPWWLSHAVGVLTVTPVLLVAVHWIRKKTINESDLFSLASFLLGMAVLVSFTIWQSEEQNFRIKLENDTSEITREVELTIEKNVQYLIAIDGLYAASEVVERSEFNAFTARFLNYMSSAQMLTWIPLVPKEDRIVYEQDAQQHGFANYQFTELDAQSQLVPASERDAYYPIHYLEPYVGNETALGLDMGSDPNTLQTIVHARDTGQPVGVTLPSQIQGDVPQMHLSVFFPIYRHNTAVDTIESRRANLLGFVSGEFRINDLVTEALNELPPRGVELFLFDVTSLNNVQFLSYNACLSTEKTPEYHGDVTVAELQTGIYSSTTLHADGQTWLAIVRPCPAYRSGIHGWAAWIAIVIGMFLSGTIIAFVGIRKRAQIQIEFQKTLLECQLEASLDGILIVSEERKWLYYNQRFVEMWEIPPTVIAIHTEQATLAHIRPLLVEPETIPSNPDHLRNHPAQISQNEIILKDGRVFEHYRAPVISSEDTYHGYLWNFRDITQRKELETQLIQAQKMEAIGRLAGGIAHDFNNILVPITLYSEMAMNKLSPDSQLYTDMQMIKESAARAADLTRQILAFGRRQVLNMQVLDLNTVVTEFEQMLLHVIREDIEYQTSLDPMLHPINADKGQIEQVLMNLVSNARDAMPTGGKLIIETTNVYLDEVYIETYANTLTVGQYIMLSVSDTGIGMDTETQRQIFEPFFTTKARGKGTGLGLATVFGIVKQHNGNIRVYSEPGMGTTFTVYLPCDESINQIFEAETVEPTSVYGTETILVAEDEEIVRQLICKTLTEHGYNILEARDPNHALQLASEHKDTLQLLLTDVIMPVMNGRELYQNVALIKPDIKVLYMSGYTNNVIAQQGVLDKGVNFISKPFTVLALTQKVRQVLG